LRFPTTEGHSGTGSTVPEGIFLERKAPFFGNALTLGEWEAHAMREGGGISVVPGRGDRRRGIDNPSEAA